MTSPPCDARVPRLAFGGGRMFGPDNARLPLPPMLMFDRITRISSEGGAFGKGEIRAEMDVRPDLWFFDCHFQGDPVMPGCLGMDAMRSEEHTSELQSLMRISYAVFCLKKQKTHIHNYSTSYTTHVESTQVSR